MRPSFRDALPFLLMILILIAAGSVLNVLTSLRTHDSWLLAESLLAVGWIVAWIFSYQQRERHSKWAWVLSGLSLAFAAAWTIIGTLRFVASLRMPVR
jgi:hypothetical protein